MLEVEVWPYEDEDWRGFVPRPHRTELLSCHVFVAWLAGFNHHPEEARDPSFDPGQPLTLVPDPDNLHDPNAIAVFNADQRLQAGWVPMMLTQRLAPTPEVRKAVALYENLVDGVREGLGILMSRQPITLRSVAPEDSDEAVRLTREVRHSKRAFAKAQEMLATDHADPVEQMRQMLEEMNQTPGGDPPG